MEFALRRYGLLIFGPIADSCIPTSTYALVAFSSSNHAPSVGKASEARPSFNVKLP